MSLYRSETFEEVHGHDTLIQFIRDRINNGSFPEATLIISEEGLGKTTLAKLIAMALNCRSSVKPCYECPSCIEIRDSVIRKNMDTDYVKTLKMSVNGGLEAGKEALRELKRGFVDADKTKVIILEECQKMNGDAQTALLADMEYIPKGVHLIAITTDELALQKDFRSRFVTYRLKRVKDKDLMVILKAEARRRKLVIQGGDAALQMIIPWAENKPRKALKVLEAMGNNANVTFEMVKEYIDFLEVKDIIPIISSLDGSLLVGIDTIMNLTIDYNSQMALITLVTEALRIKTNSRSMKLSNEDNALLREALQGVDLARLTQFLYDISSAKVLTKQALLASFIRAHPQHSLLQKPNENVLADELALVHTNSKEEIVGISTSQSEIPSMHNLIRSGDVMGGE